MYLMAPAVNDSPAKLQLGNLPKRGWGKKRKFRRHDWGKVTAWGMFEEK